METETYTDLVMRTREGDLDAFGELVERFQDMAVGYAWGRVGDLADAVDVAQEAFIDALRKIELLRDPVAFPRWFQTIVGTHCARRRRERQRPEAVPAPPDQPAVEEGVVERERAERVRRLVAALPPGERVVVAMHYLSGCSYAEIGSFLGISEGAAKQRAHTARARMRDDWEDPMDIGGAIEPDRPSRDRRFSSTTLLFAAIAKEDTAVARRLLDADPSLVDVEESWDDETARAAGMLPARDASPLLRAVGRGSRELVELLLEHGADVNRTCGCDGDESPLWAATVQGDEQLVELLLEHGADPDDAAFRGTTPLHVAAMRGHGSIAQRLIGAGADPNVRDEHGRSPADWAELKGTHLPLIDAEGGQDASPELLESGIKAINLLAPLHRGGVVRWVGPPGTGSLVVLTELVHNLATFEGLAVDVIGFEHEGLTAAELRHAFAELDPSVSAVVRLAPADQDVAGRRRVFADAVLRSGGPRGGHRPHVVVVAAHPAHLADIEAELLRLLDAAELVIIVDFDGQTTEGMQLPSSSTTIALDERLARAEIFPAIDPARTSGPCRPGAHEATADATRDLLARYVEDPGLPLEPDGEPWTRVARDLLEALTQPFHTTEPFTGRPGATVSIDDSVQMAREILDGERPVGLDDHTMRPRGRANTL